ncbi:MAG TPA: RnfH family protein [Dyella sp.]|uniref:RnfH family protein n=1 Tax=Dyella sp. TaxID=1869338 RepID=UPI002C889BC5|nr:RnfH family protein [Dyella sp.]HTV86959.1 RnfH family protein [Dyella sp.]
MADITVEVVCATPGRQLLRQVTLPAGSRVAEAVERSGILKEMPEVVYDRARLGIFSRRVEPDEVLRDGDRVEIYRPLTLDPKDARRRRAG